ncbi:hypothetical protein FA95DRAFT_1649083 [Auriscalpium vulgare]|uniref:Uncharacterized protein n=1 Tax=Auriscalpium vulgare TaxID=40419 RepID=A0ACB8RZC1_9AGAM|nr:hypothetical protein FA95DRAFT_1649083 [Auriscalpium vulgare]
MQRCGSPLSSASSFESTTPPSDPDSNPELDANLEFGHPLQRMVPLETMDMPIEEMQSVAPKCGLYCIPTSEASSTASHRYYIDFEAVVDEYLSQYAEGDEWPDLVFVESAKDDALPNSRTCSLILRRMPCDGEELAILRALNSDEVRHDPWNPAPRVLYVAERGGIAVVCLERLFEYDQPPMQTVADVIDYIRQALEGLSFLHEHKIAHRGYGHVNGVMMDIGRSSAEDFDRSKYPVRYYRVNFSQAQRVKDDGSVRGAAFRRDVQDLGGMLEGLVDEVPKIGGKLRSLVRAMGGGEYGADDGRRLFDALCRGIDSATHDAPL